MRRTLYFAFGSNMDGHQMARRCPSAEEVGPSSLDGFRFAYAGLSASRGAGVATLIKDETSTVWGMLYSITVKDLHRLDRFEGAPFWYKRDKQSVRLFGESRKRAWTYILEQPLNPPTVEYHNIIAEAYESLGLDTKPLHDAVVEAYGVKNRPVKRTRPSLFPPIWATV